MQPVAIVVLLKGLWKNIHICIRKIYDISKLSEEISKHVLGTLRFSVRGTLRFVSQSFIIKNEYTYRYRQYIRKSNLYQQ